LSQSPGIASSQVVCDGPAQEDKVRYFLKGYSIKRKYFCTIKVCNTNACPAWSTWSSWGECSVTCGGGKRLRTRKCTLPDGSTSDLLYCPGKETDDEKCNERKCPGNAEMIKLHRSKNLKVKSNLVLGPWSDWTPCSVTCGGGGTKERKRECGLPKSSSSNPCLEPLVEREACGEKKCPVFTDWSGW